MRPHSATSWAISLRAMPPSANAKGRPPSIPRSKPRRVTGSIAVGRSVAHDQLLALRAYSREQELEADRVGVGYIMQAGYRGDAMTSLIDKLQRQSRLEALLFGQTPETAVRRSALSTHPAPDERLAALRRDRRRAARIFRAAR